MNKILELRDITVGYKNSPAVLNGVNLTVFERDFLGIIGPNGGGKTTLLKTILNLLNPISGDICFYQNGERSKKIKIGYLPQINQIDKKFPISVRDVILSGISAKSCFAPYTKEQKQMAEEVAVQMGVIEFIDKAIGELSGGQLQRTLLGRAIVDGPELLVLDEPNSYVDKKFESSFYKILEVVNETTAIIMVSHDVGTVLSIVKNIACVNGGLHYHIGTNVSSEWINSTYNCPIDIVGHGDFPHRVLGKHEGCDCCED